MKHGGMPRFEGAVAYVNAAAGAGIGSAVVRGLLAEGATVIATDVSEKRISRLEAELLDQYDERKILTRVVDATSEEAVAEIFDEMRGRFTQLDVLVNTVGLNRLEPLPELKLETWMAVINACLTSHFLHVRAAWPLLMASDVASVVGISSLASESPTAFGECAYAAAKAGVLGLSKAIATEGAAHGIRSNAVMPGLIWNDNLTKAVVPEYVKEYRSKRPLGRDGTPAEVADVVLFLASRASRHVTGEVVKVAA